MKPAWKQIAGIGTDKQAESIPEQEKAIENFRESLGQGKAALRFLAGAGLETMQKLAGYLVPFDSQHLTMPDKTLPNLPYETAALQQVARMFWGYFPEIFGEWLHWAAISHSTMPAEAIPLLLNLASQFPYTRPLTKRMVGSRGRWLVKQSQANQWRWMNEIETGKSPRIGKQKKQEERIGGMLKRGIFYNLGSTVRTEMRQLEHPWSLRFSNFILETLQGVMNRNRQLSIHDQLELMTIIRLGIHPHLGSDLVGTFADYSQDSEVKRKLLEMQQVLAFRMELRQTFGILD